MSNAHACFVAILDKWDGPFEAPIRFNRETGALQANEIMIHCYNKTKSGQISRVGGGYLHINYCPLCGEKVNHE